MPSDHCKQAGSTSGAARGLLRMGLIGLAALSACRARPRTHAISVSTLETATVVKPAAMQRAIVSDLGELGDLYHPLGPRLGLVQVRTKADWETLRRCAPELGPPPDLSHGIAIGLASHAGLPLNGDWPVHLETVRVHDGAGFAVASFGGGSFLPDGSTYLETAQFDGLATVLMVEINGTRFYPK